MGPLVLFHNDMSDAFPSQETSFPFSPSHDIISVRHSHSKLFFRDNKLVWCDIPHYCTPDIVRKDGTHLPTSDTLTIPIRSSHSTTRGRRSQQHQINHESTYAHIFNVNQLRLRRPGTFSSALEYGHVVGNDAPRNGGSLETSPSIPPRSSRTITKIHGDGPRHPGTGPRTVAVSSA